MKEEKSIELNKPNFRDDEQAKKSGNGLGLKLTCGFLALATLGLGAFVVYDKFFATQPEKTEISSSIANQHADKSEKEEQVKKNKNGFVYHTDTTEPGYLIVDGNGDVYFDPNEHYSDAQGLESYNFNFATANIDGEKGSYSLDGDEINFHTYPSNDEQKITFSGYKLNIKNISSIIQAECGQNFTAHYYLAITQSGDAYMIIIKPGGMTSAVDNFSDSEAKLKINKLSYKDIISASMINLGDSIGTMVVDKVGSHFYLSDKDFEIK